MNRSDVCLANEPNWITLIIDDHDSPAGVDYGGRSWEKSGIGC